MCASVYALCEEIQRAGDLAPTELNAVARGRGGGPEKDLVRIIGSLLPRTSQEPIHRGHQVERQLADARKLSRNLTGVRLRRSEFCETFNQLLVHCDNRVVHIGGSFYCPREHLLVFVVELVIDPKIHGHLHALFRV